jgi:hypothetical protein
MLGPVPCCAVPAQGLPGSNAVLHPVTLMALQHLCDRAQLWTAGAFIGPHQPWFMAAR